MLINFIDLKAQQDLIKNQIQERINKVLEHGNYIMGPEVGELEAELSKFCGAKHSITCANGTDALQLALMALNLETNDVVFCPSFTFASTAEVIPIVGGVPFFVDVDLETFNLCPKSLRECIKETRKLGLRPVGVMPVDLFGSPANYEEIQEIAAENKLWILADSAQGFGATYKEKSTGNIGDVATTSFFPAKPLGCYGDGGSIFTSNDEIAEKLNSLRIHGKGHHKYENVRIGMNSRLDTLQAAILLEKLSIYPDEIVKRNVIANRYTAELQGLITTPFISKESSSVWAQYTVRAPDEKSRQHLMDALKTHGIPTAIYYPKPLHKQKAYTNFPSDPNGLYNSEKLSETVFSLPMHPYIQNEMQDYVITTLKKALSSLG